MPCQVIADWINSLPGTPALAPPVTHARRTAAFSPRPTSRVLHGAGPERDDLLHAGRLTAHDQFLAVFRRVHIASNATVSANAFETNFNNSAPPARCFVQPVNFTSAGFLTNQQFQLGFAGMHRQQLRAAGHHEFRQLDAHQHQQGRDQPVQPVGSPTRRIIRIASTASGSNELEAPHAYPRKTAGFTLIELLVVIAIIAILAALLLPALVPRQAKGPAGRLSVQSQTDRPGISNVSQRPATIISPTGAI